MTLRGLTIDTYHRDSIIVTVPKVPRARWYYRMLRVPCEESSVQCAPTRSRPPRYTIAYGYRRPAVHRRAEVFAFFEDALWSCCRAVRLVVMQCFAVPTSPWCVMIR